MMLTNIVKGANDEEISLLVNQAHLQKFVLALLKDFTMKNVQSCVRFFGNLFAINEQACTHYVKNEGFLDLLGKVFTYCTKSVRKEALWVLSNIAANSAVDACAIADHSIMINLLLSG